MPLPKREGDIWSGYIAGLKPGTVYGYRAHGPYDPAQGHRFNPNSFCSIPMPNRSPANLSGTMPFTAMG